MTQVYAIQILFSAIANSGDWASSDIIQDDFYKELKVVILNCIYYENSRVIILAQIFTLCNVSYV